MPAFIDLTDQEFGRLTVKRLAQRDKRGRAMWRCRCDCGAEVVVLGDHLRSEHTESCGCRKRQALAARSTTHGHSRRNAATPTYQAWANMIQRCTNGKLPRFKDYGGRGISVCERWLRFENFLRDMGERPEGMTLDRYPENDGNYEPGNCRWATRKEQAQNRRTNRLLTIYGKTRPLAAWAELSGETQYNVGNRLSNGWTEKESVFGRAA